MLKYILQNVLTGETVQLYVPQVLRKYGYHGNTSTFLRNLDLFQHCHSYFTTELIKHVTFFQLLGSVVTKSKICNLTVYFESIPTTIQAPICIITLPFNLSNSFFVIMSPSRSSSSFNWKCQFLV